MKNNYIDYFLGATVHIGIHPSKVAITKPKLDKDRKALLDRRDSTKRGLAEKGKITSAQVESTPMQVEK